MHMDDYTTAGRKATCCVSLVQFPAIIMQLEAVLKELPDERLNPASVPTPHSCCTVQ